jgi:ABC-type polysaccharide/polyol phosphate transport system ATPase subunit
MSEAMSDREPVIVVERLAKSYRRYPHKPFILRNMLARLTGRPVRTDELWPLRDVSFTVYQGEAVALMGRNGSGKTTLLRMIAGASYPTFGTISVRGRIGPLLALGQGFHEDMTGRECIQVNGTILGMTRSELRDRFDRIIEFADLGDFLDTPVRYYSSGMGARLAFSIAIHTEPDLLLIDEILAVGDHAFQKKCADRIAELRARGTTMLLVTHATETIAKLCDRVLWLRDGRLVHDGPLGVIRDEYERAA